MSTSKPPRRWWVAVVVVSVLALAVLTTAVQFMPDYLDHAGVIAFAAIGAVFCWLYVTDKERLWWAIIPGVAAFATLVAIFANRFIGTDPANDWISGFIFGIGSAITAALLRRRNPKTVLVIVTMFCLLVGIAMAPLEALPKVALIAVDILVALFVVLRIRRVQAASN